VVEKEALGKLWTTVEVKTKQESGRMEEWHQEE